MAGSGTGQAIARDVSGAGWAALASSEALT
jgi:hypothetical protein